MDRLAQRELEARQRRVKAGLERFIAAHRRAAGDDSHPIHRLSQEEGQEVIREMEAGLEQVRALMPHNGLQVGEVLIWSSLLARPPAPARLSD